MTTSITIAGASGAPISGISARKVSTWVGNWYADVEVDASTFVTLPTGPVTLTIGTTPLVGVVDPRASGTFGNKASLRILGGTNPSGLGWEDTILAIDMANDAGITSQQVIAAAGAQIGETAVVAPPTVVGTHFTLSKGPASRVLAGLEWHVDPATGVTMVSPRVPTPLVDPTSFTILDFDPVAQRARVAGDGVLEPGVVLVDPRTLTPLTVRDVEQSWTKDGARSFAWTGSSVTASRLAGALQRLAYEACGVTYLRTYRCRVVLQGADGRLALQPIEVGELSPATVLTLVPTKFGVPGVAMKIPPGTEVILSFNGGDPTQPEVREFAGTPAIELDVTATTLIKVTAPSVTVGPAPLPVASAPSVETVFTALSTFASALATYAAAIKAIADPTNAATPALLSGITALESAISSTSSTLATTVLEAS